MPYRLVTLAQAKRQLSMIEDDADQDTRVDGFIMRASAAVMEHIRTAGLLPFIRGWTDAGGDPLVDSAGNPRTVASGYLRDDSGQIVYDDNGDPVADPISTQLSIVPGVVQQACLVTVAAWEADREGAMDGLPQAAKYLLETLRDPVFA